MSINTTINPLLDFSNLYCFNKIRPEHVTPALDILLESANLAVNTASSPATLATWSNIVNQIEKATELLNQVWNVVSHLNAVVDTPELRSVYSQNLLRVTEFWANIGQNLALYDKYKSIVESAEYEMLSMEKKRILDNAIRDFRLSGAELHENEKLRFVELRERQAILSKTFSEHVLDATEAYAYYVQDEDMLIGLPDDSIASAREIAQKEGKDGWKFTLNFASYFPVLQYSDNRMMRETLYRAYVTRASELRRYGESRQSRFDNTGIIIEELNLRQEEARMLGYKNFAELSLASKMAKSPKQVVAFLKDIAERARPYGEREWNELRIFASKTLGLDEVEPWDIAYVSEKLRQQCYAFSENEVKKYFPETAVLKGLFTLVEVLFNIRIYPEKTSTWHQSVQFFRIESDDGSLIAQFYLDLYARKNKRGGAWMNSARSRMKRDNLLQTPIAYIICNFSGPVNRKPACFTHYEVITLFHEFGHGLHHMLTRVNEPSISGINGVEWDAVELPSQFMENFCWDLNVLTSISSHVDTSEPLPRKLFNKMINAKNFQVGLATLRQIVFSMFDILIHIDFDPYNVININDFSNEINMRFHVIPQPSFSRWPNTFSHIFSDGYAAGYYSYKWAEVLSADVYAVFEDAAKKSGTILDVSTGARYLHEILEVGGSRSAISSFKAFRGREPKIDAFLRHSGLIASGSY
ncbi:MAG: M3 family metallopeptidase [Burkholderia sp.]|nr:M3 family metallopeptidase [Burkholderia sp.]